MKKLRASIQVLKRYGGMIRPYDIVIIIALIVLSFTPIVIFSVQQKQQAQRNELAAKNGTQPKHPTSIRQWFPITARCLNAST